MNRIYQIIELPTVATISESRYIYTAWNFVSEFGGWVGIFLGFCAADVYQLLEAAMEYQKHF